MALSRYDPFFFRTPFDDLFTLTPALGVPPRTGSGSGSLMMTPSMTELGDFHSPRFMNHHPYQVREDDKSYEVAIDVPGLKPEDMKVHVDEDTKVLHLSGERKYNSPDGKSYSERSFSYKMTLGDDVMPDKLSAHLEHGVLTLTAPKKPKVEEKPKPNSRLIQISTGDDGADKKKKLQIAKEAGDDEKKE